MKVENYIKETLKNHKIHLTLLDPEEQSPEEAVCLRFEDVALADRKGSGAKMTQAADNFQ